MDQQITPLSGENSAWILEKIAEGYLKYSHPKDVKDQQKEQQLKFIQAQIATLEKKLPQIKQGIEKLQQQYNFIDPKLQTEYLFKQGESDYRKNCFQNWNMVMSQCLFWKTL